jgi:hypothetical protein
MAFHRFRIRLHKAQLIYNDIMSRWAFLGGVLLMSVAVGQLMKKPPTVILANKFLDSLTKEQRAKAVKSFDDPYRTNWRYVPASREGINLGDMTPEQAKLASDLLRTSLSRSGYNKTQVIKILEDVLFEIENKNKMRDKNLYTFTFFGEPKFEGKWGWRYEGHHVSLNFTFKNGDLVSSSPQFLGSNPAVVPSGPQKGLRALPQEQDMGDAFVKSLNPDQLSKAVIAPESPSDVVTSNTRKAGIQAKSGLAYKDMTAEQKKNLMAIVLLYAQNQTLSEAKHRMDRVEPDSLVFAWMGNYLHSDSHYGPGHYYRIQGSKFLIEFDNTQNNANHIHSVWRDFDGDFGDDVLAEHYAQSHP